MQGFVLIRSSACGRCEQYLCQKGAQRFFHQVDFHTSQQVVRQKVYYVDSLRKLLLPNEDNSAKLTANALYHPISTRVRTHAVPQEIMSVDFKLFGNFLSLREFLFIAVGLAIAWFFWFLMQQKLIPGIIAVPISFIIGGGGIMVGLVPIQDRPLDKWILAYFSAINRPTQRVWKKTGYVPSMNTDASSLQVKDYAITPPTQTQGVFVSAPLTTDAKRPDTSVIEVERTEIQDMQRIEETLKTISEPKSIQNQTVVTNLPSFDTSNSLPQSSSIGTFNTQQPPFNTPAYRTTQTQIAPSTTFSDVISFQPKEVHSMNTSATSAQEEQTSALSGTILLGNSATTPGSSRDTEISAAATSPSATFSEGNFPPGITVLPVADSTQTPLVNPQQPISNTLNSQNQVPPPPSDNTPVYPLHPAHPVQQENAQLPPVLVIDDDNIHEYSTTIPGLEEKNNTINIVVKDVNGLIMSGVVCVIKNANGAPVRAAISNILGQIMNNIPLKDGMYKITLTKQGYVFPEVTRNLTGHVYAPIEIKSL